MVVQACLSGVVKQSGSGPPSRQIFDSISIRTESPKPSGLVAWSEKYLEGKRNHKRSSSRPRRGSAKSGVRFQKGSFIFKQDWGAAVFVKKKKKKWRRRRLAPAGRAECEKILCRNRRTKHRQKTTPSEGITDKTDLRECHLLQSSHCALLTRHQRAA